MADKPRCDCWLTSQGVGQTGGMDLNLAKSDLGMLIISSAMLNDLVGWIVVQDGYGGGRLVLVHELEVHRMPAFAAIWPTSIMP